MWVEGLTDGDRDRDTSTWVVLFETFKLYHPSEYNILFISLLPHTIQLKTESDEVVEFIYKLHHQSMTKSNVGLKTRPKDDWKIYVADYYLQSVLLSWIKVDKHKGAHLSK